MIKICIAGKNNCAVDAAQYLINILDKEKISILPNKNDDGIDRWQPSLKKFAVKNKLKIIKLKNLYEIRKLFFFSIEYESILKIENFKSKNLFNIHFSLLPKYRGCHTNYLQIKNGEKKSGVTLHKIDNGIDTGDIVDQINFKVQINDTALDNYNKLMKYSFIIFKKNLKKILDNNYKIRKQGKTNSSYFPRNFVNYLEERVFKKKENTLRFHNQIRSLIFPFYQLPEVNKKKVIRSFFRNNKVILKYND